MSGGRLSAWVPRWWAGDGGAAGRALHTTLAPAEAGYRAVVRARNELYDRGWLRAARAPIPVVSVGNIGVGGAGKTPFAAWLAAWMDARGLDPAVVLRGYGGDEVQVHAELNPGVPVFAAARRIHGVRDAARAGRRVAVLDDAFQHRAVRRDLDVVLVSAEGWEPERNLLPRGPWREEATALRRADLVVVTRKSADPEHAEAVAQEVGPWAPAVPRILCSFLPDGVGPLHLHGSHDEWRAESLLGVRVLAVAALADPRPFAENLRSMGAEVELVSFPDHHAYTAADAEAVLSRAAGRRVVTTHKDAVKLRHLLPLDAPVRVLRQRVEIDRGVDLLEHALERLTAGARG